MQTIKSRFYSPQRRPYRHDIAPCLMVKTGVRSCLLIILLLIFMAPARAQESMSMVRDAEIESILARWNAPVWREAGLNPNSVRIILVNSDDINAFTAGGQVIFITTGLLKKADDPAEIIGVIAHETGHIVGGHVLLRQDKARNASFESLIGMVLGAGAGILSGNGQLGSAIMTMGQAGAMHGYLAHSRLEESGADQAALSYMQRANLPVRGLATFFHKLENDELLPPEQQRGYARTHPVTRDRVEAIQTRIDAIPAVQTPDSEKALLKRLQAKLIAFTNPSRAMAQYKGDSPTDLMARAIVAYRQNRMKEALNLAEQWTAKEPENPYAYEFKAQILKDSGQPAKAVPVYEKALAKTRSALIRIDAAHAMLESHDPSLTDKAIGYLNVALRSEPQNSFAYSLLANAYGDKKMEPEAQIVLADRALRQGSTKRAKELLAIAWPRLSQQSPERRRASDLKLLLDSLPEAD